MQILTNASFGEAAREATGTIGEAPQLLKEGGAGLLGMFFANLTRNLTSPLMARVPGGAMIAQIVGGAVGVIGARFGSSLVFGSGSRMETAATIGALVNAMKPLSQWAQNQMANVPNFPGKAAVTSALGSYYMGPVGGEYAMTAKLQGFSPGDFGGDVSENFPAMASLGGEAPNFNSGGDQYNQGHLGAPLGTWTPDLAVM